MSTYPDLLILRHGETQWNLEGRMQGALDSPLTARGVEQAKAQNRILTEFGIDGRLCFTSPQGRALSTAKIALGSNIAVADPRLVEIGVGDWAGKLRADLLGDLPRYVEIDEGPDGAIALYKYAPNGEGFEALRDRVTSFLKELTGPSVIVTHGITSRMLRAVILGMTDDQLGELPGGQGVAYHLCDGVQIRLE